MKQADPNEHDPFVPNFDELWDYSNPESTEKVFLDLLSDLKLVNQSKYLELKTQLARTQSLQRAFEKAHTILEEVKEQLENVNSGNELVIPRIRYHLELGRTFNSNKEKEKASVEFQKAYKLAIDIKHDFFAVDAAHMLAISEPADKKLNWNLEALKIAEKSESARTRKWCGSLLNNLGWDHHGQGDFTKAMDYFKRALQHHESVGKQSGIFIAKWTIGRTFRSLGEIDKAIAIQKSLLKEIEEKQLEQDGYVFEELAECYFIQNNSADAKKYFGLAYDVLSKDIWLKANEQKRLERMMELARKC